MDPSLLSPFPLALLVSLACLFPCPSCFHALAISSPNAFFCFNLIYLLIDFSIQIIDLVIWIAKKYVR